MAVSLKRVSILVLLLSAALAAPAAAQFGRNDGQYGRNDNRGQAFDTGYRDGLQRGERDGRDGRTSSYQNDSWYRSGDRGYDRRYGDRESYRRDYRSGFASGYNDALYRYNGGNGTRGNDRAVPRQGYPGTNQRYPGSPSQNRYPDTRGNRGYGYNPGAEAGYADGYDQGLEDSRDNDRFDPTRHGRYRSADHNYNSRYGSREQYKNAYRDGFRQGYEEAYRDARQYGGRNRNDNGGNGLPWPF